MRDMAIGARRAAAWQRAAAVGALVFVGCGGASPPASHPETTRANVPAATPETAALPTVRLLTPGTAPRQKLRYRFSAGPSQWAQLDMKMTMGIGVSESPSLMPLPTIRTTMRFDPKSVTPEGDLRYEFETTAVTLLRDVPAAPEVRTKLEQSLASLVGLRGHAVVTSRGITKDADFTIPPDAPANIQDTLENLRSSVRQLCAPLPEEEVGKGAIWETELNLVTPALRLKQTSTQTLQELRPGGASTQYSVIQTAPRQVMNLKRLEGIKVELQSILSTGDGKAEVNFDKLVSRSSLHLAANMHMLATTADGTTGKLLMTMVLDTATEPSAPGRSPR